MAAPPFEITFGRIENCPVDTARPDSDIFVHFLLKQRVDHALRRRHQRIAAMVETAQDRFDHRLCKPKPIIARIGFEPCVNGGKHRGVMLGRPAHRCMSGGIRRGHMNDVRRKSGEVLVIVSGQPCRKAIFSTGGYRKARHANQVAGRLECRRAGGWRIHAK